MQLIRFIWDFFQYQILGMKWLNELIGRCLNTLGINIGTRVDATAAATFAPMVQSSMSATIPDGNRQMVKRKTIALAAVEVTADGR